VEPLRSITMQHMVPGLFQLSQHPLLARRSTGHGSFNGYRLDAMLHCPTQDINLARLLAGHGGSLAWVLSVWLHRRVEMDLSKVPAPPVELDFVRQQETASLNAKVKHLFDPRGIFMPIPFSKG
jgi:hypothetical protein